MRILFLTAHLPFPPFSGGRRREFELISRLSRKFEIYLCSITKTWEIDNIHMENLRHHCVNVNLFESASIDKELYSSYSHQMKRHISEEASSHISLLLKDSFFDIVHIEGYYLMQHLPTKLKIPVLLVEHNIEYLLNLQQLALATPKDKSYHWQKAINTLKWERMFWKQATICITLTNEDKTSMIKLEPNLDIRMIPNGIDHQKTIDKVILANNHKIHSISTKYPSILFVGNFAYEPNIDAALYFSQIIFPMILKAVPNVKLFLVGNAPSPEICSLTLNKQIEVTGFVASLLPFYETADVVVCPLRRGGGVKVKILEALSTAKAIVSTSIGTQGLDLIANQAVIIADEATDFAENVVRLLLKPKERYQQEQAALSYARTLPTWDEVSEAFEHCYKEIGPKRAKPI